MCDLGQRCGASLFRENQGAVSRFCLSRSYNGLHLERGSLNQGNVISGLLMPLLSIYERTEPEEPIAAQEEIFC
jgi:hypothetical protein